MTCLPAQLQAAPGLFASSLALSPCRAWSSWYPSLYSAQRGMKILAGGVSPKTSVQHYCCRRGHLLQLAVSGRTKAAVWPHVTFSSDTPFSLLHPSTCPAPLSLSYAYLMSHISEPTQVKQSQHSNKTCFSVCVFANHDLVYQLVGTAEEKGSLLSWSKPPRTCRGWRAHQHWHWHHHLG